MFLLVPAHPGFLRHNPWSHETVVCFFPSALISFISVKVLLIKFKACAIENVVTIYKLQIH